MKTLFKVSIFLNLALAAGLVFALSNRPKRSADPGPPVVAKAHPQPTLVVANTVPRATPVAGAKPFCWSQLTAKDYRSYVQNLRAIGCPESTVRAIVAADADAVFSRRSKALEQQLSELAKGSWTARLAAADTETALKAELQNLPAEEDALINDMLGLRATPSSTEKDLAASDGPEEEPAPTKPLVLQEIDLAKLNLSESQIGVINDLRQSFLKKIGGPNQDPNDPAYLQRWEQAQPETDEMLRGMLGRTVFQNFQMAAFGSSQAQAAAKP